jgi:uncharacterized protein YycO
MSRLAMLLSLLWTASAACAEPLRDGDIIFQASRSSQSLAIQRATHSPYSHMGMIVHRDGKPHVLEAVATVRYTALDRWVARADRGHYVVKRLDGGLSREQARKLLSTADRFAGRPYDLYFEWSDDRIYCSELVWKAYREALGVELGARQKLRSFDLSDSAVKIKMRERYGSRVPLDEPVISPGAMFASTRLVTIVTEGKRSE